MAAAAAPVNPNPLLPPRLGFPMDLTAYGIRGTGAEHIITNFEDLQNATPTHIEVHNLMESPYEGVLRLIKGCQFTLNGLVHKIETTIGNPGVFGIGYQVVREDGTILFLKSFINHDYNPESPESRRDKYEGITQAIIHRTTVKPLVNHDDCEYTPHCNIFTADIRQADAEGELIVPSVQTKRLFILQTNYGIDGINGKTLQDFIGSPQFTIPIFRSIFVKLARKLFVLQNLYNFNHGDLHSSNVFVVPNVPVGAAGVGNWSPRLIDYGFSLMHLDPGNPATAFGANNKIDNNTIINLNEARDLVFLSSSLRPMIRHGPPGRPTDVELFILSPADYSMLRQYRQDERVAHWVVNEYFNNEANRENLQNARPINVLAEFNDLNVRECIAPPAAPTASAAASGGAGSGNAATPPAAGGAGSGNTGTSTLVSKGGARKQQKPKKTKRYRQTKKRKTRRISFKKYIK